MSINGNCVSITEENRDLLSNLLDEHKWVLLLGSAISIWSPSGIPTGQAIRSTIYETLNFEEVLKGSDKLLSSILYEVLGRFPFELLMDRCPQRNRAEEILLSFFKYFRTPNPIQLQLANFFVEGKVSSIITPNYDVCLENAIKTVDPSFQFNNVSIQEQAENIPIGNCLFKIHGSVDDKSKASLVFMMRQEGRLKDWKRLLLKKLIAGKNLLIIGYSGYDFDICPEIPLARPERIYWNYLYKKDITLNAKDVAEKVETHFILGDMRKLLEFMGNPVTADIDKNYEKNIQELKYQFQINIATLYRKLWRLKIFNSINFNEIVIRESKELLEAAPNSSFLVEVLSEKATALSNGGKYQQAALVYANATDIARKAGLSRDFRVKSDLAAHSWLSNGNLIQYLIWNGKSKRATPKNKNNSGVESNEIQFLRDLYGLFSRLRITPFTNILRKKAHQRIENLGVRIHIEGNWHAINRLQKLAADFDIPPKNIRIIREYDLLPVEYGYYQVAMPIGQMMAYRKSLEIGATPISKTSYENGKKLLKQAQYLGIYAEVWKLAITLDTFFKNWGDNHFDEFWLGFNNCEYTKMKRRQYFKNASNNVYYL